MLLDRHAADQLAASIKRADEVEAREAKLRQQLDAASERAAEAAAQVAAQQGEVAWLRLC